jgi:hypothetical protein
MQIMNEFLDALEAEETLTAIDPMSRNYETAQSNPEINLIPGNLKDARDAIFPYFWGTDGWNSRFHLENVKGPANYASLVGSIAMLSRTQPVRRHVQPAVQRAGTQGHHLAGDLVFTLPGSPGESSPWEVPYPTSTAERSALKSAAGAMKGGSGTAPGGIVSHAAHYSKNMRLARKGRQLVSIPTDDACSMDLLTRRRMDRVMEKGPLCHCHRDLRLHDAFA